MPIRNQNWYDLQANRRYPLDDRSTGIDDQGTLLRDNILVDCHIRYPEDLGQYVYVQGVTVTPTLATIVFGAAASLNATDGTTIAAISLPANSAQNVNHEVLPLQPGVAGWVVLGPGIEESFVGRFQKPQQALLLPRCARAYRPLPVPATGKFALQEALQDVVTLNGTAPVTIRQETVEIEGIEVPALVFRLEGTAQGENPLSYFLGPCGQRPESNTCPKPAVTTINGIGTDCDGNINIEIVGFTAAPYLGGGGIDIIASTGLSDACAVGTKSTKPLQDNCNPDATGDDDGWQNPIDQIPADSSMSESLPDIVPPSSCVVTPYCLDFTSGTASAFQVMFGLFAFEPHTAPGTCSDESERLQYTYVAAAGAIANVSVFRNCTDPLWQFGKTITAEIQITPDGIEKNGGIVFNFVPRPLLPGGCKYLVAVLDANKNKLRLLRYNGDRYIVEDEINFTVRAKLWYRLSVHIVNGGVGNKIITVSAESVDGTVSSSAFTVPVVFWDDDGGQVGLYSYRAYTYFNQFTITG